MATGYLENRYQIPSWAVPMLQSGVHGLAGIGHLGGFSDWAQENPWVFSLLGQTFTTIGQQLTAKQVQDAIKSAIPKDILTKSNISEIIAALQVQGAIPAGKEDTVAAGIQGALGPSWLMPVAILGIGGLLFYMIARK